MATLVLRLSTLYALRFLRLSMLFIWPSQSWNSLSVVLSIFSVSFTFYFIIYFFFSTSVLLSFSFYMVNKLSFSVFSLFLSLFLCLSLDFYSIVTYYFFSVHPHPKTKDVHLQQTTVFQCIRFENAQKKLPRLTNTWKRTFSFDKSVCLSIFTRTNIL